MNVFLFVVIWSVINFHSKYLGCLEWHVHMDMICAFVTACGFQCRLLTQCTGGKYRIKDNGSLWIESGSLLVLQAVSTSPSKLITMLRYTYVFLNVCVLL